MPKNKSRSWTDWLKAILQMVLVYFKISDGTTIADSGPSIEESHANEDAADEAADKIDEEGNHAVETTDGGIHYEFGNK